MYVSRGTAIGFTLDRLIRGLNPERIVLYGSRAFGSFTPGSDVDLLLMADSGADPTVLLRRARQLTSRAFPPIDFVVSTPEQVDDAYAGKSPFLLSILERGVTVYQRPRRPGVAQTAAR